MTHSTSTKSAVISRANKSTQQECWANFGAAFATGEGRAYLQPGQFLPIWHLVNADQWRCKTAFSLTVMAAFVVANRYMVKGGDSKLSSHPLIEEWDQAQDPMAGAATELRFPGGLKRVHASNIPTLVGNRHNYESAAITAKKFHRDFASAEQRDGNPIKIVCRRDACEPFHGIPFAAYDTLRREVIPVLELPFPIITSNEEEIILKDYPATWTAGLVEYAARHSITEIGVMHSNNDTDDVIESISTERPNLIFRNAINQGDLGFSTLDPNLHERMLPFASGQLDIDLL